jgi:SAM-dependent methyltransferase
LIETYRQLKARNQFIPTWIGLFVNPYYIARRGLYRSIAELAKELSGDSLLDLGCGSKPYRELFTHSIYTGLELDTEQNRAAGHAELFYDGHSFPFKAAEYDNVLCNQVLEHVFNPEEFLAEIFRVLKPGGQLLLTVPFVWDEHEQPSDYARYSSFGLQHLLKGAGFEVKALKKSNPDLSTIFQLLNAYLYKVSQTWPSILREMFTVTFMALMTLLGMVSKLLPDNSDLFLDLIVLAEKPDHTATNAAAIDKAINTRME